jgi:hypothetical protein
MKKCQLKQRKMRTRERPRRRVNAEGYVRLEWMENGRDIQELEHQRIWKRANGSIPNGYEIHHKDENKENNSLANLELLTFSDHRRIHRGQRLTDGKWFKKCKVCDEWLESTPENFETTKTNVRAVCKKCYPAIKSRSFKSWYDRKHGSVISGKKLKQRL